MWMVLVVDDDRDVLETVADSVRSLPDVLVQTAMSGKKALELARARDFDLFITDAQMPIMSGIELLTQLKRERPDTAVIVMSGDAMLRHRAIRTGADGILAKPFRLEHLTGLVTSFLHNPIANRRPHAE